MPSQAEIIQSTAIVNETLRLYPATAAVFNRFGIDACCGGAASIEEAATRDGAKPRELLDALTSVIAAALTHSNQAA